MSGITRFFLASSLVILASATLNISAATVSGIAPRECRFNDGYPAYPPKICTRHVLEHDNQSEMDYCAYLAFSKANQKLNSVYSRVMAKGHHSFLVTAELEWLKYRDKFCRVEVHQVCGGSMEPMVKYNCLADLTKEQTKNIKSTYWFIFRSDPAHLHHRNGSKGTLDKNAVKSYVFHETADHAKTLSSATNSKYCDFLDEMQRGQAVERAIPTSRKPICVNPGDLPNSQEACRGAHLHSPSKYRIYVGRAYGHYRCAFATSTRGSTRGWISSEKVRIISVKTKYKSTSWVGNWREIDGDDTISIKKVNNKIEAIGNAVYPSYNPPKRYFPGGANFGSFKGYAIPDKDAAVFGRKPGCLVYIRLLGGTLIVNDNGACGGGNVTFSGAYSRY